jgi:hypothetical protein
MTMFKHTIASSPVLATAIDQHLNALHHELARVLENERILAVTGSTNTTDAVVALELIAIADRIDRAVSRIINEEQRLLARIITDFEDNQT